MMALQEIRYQILDSIRDVLDRLPGIAMKRMVVAPNRIRASSLADDGPSDAKRATALELHAISTTRRRRYLDMGKALRFRISPG